MSPIRVLVVCCGNMGASHARAYRALVGPEGFDLVGLVSRGPTSRERLAAELGRVPTYSGFDEALAATRPDAVSINTYPDTHADLAAKSLRAGAHVFVEKPLATTVAAARQLVALARSQRRALVVGYILRVHPTWRRFIDLARTLGKPLVMRMNLNQQSRGKEWATHQALLASMSPIVDCGVHYVDVMCQMTRSRPVRVSAIGARLSAEIAADMHNYGQLQVAFADGSVGWYEAGWGPMISEAAHSVKDVIGPRGSVSILDHSSGGSGGGGGDADRDGASSDIAAHTATSRLRVHWAERGADGDEAIAIDDVPDHDGLCRLEQQLFLRAIRDELDLTEHLDAAVDSLRIVLAADQSARSGQTVEL